MPIGEIEALPGIHLALLQEDAEAALAAARTLKDWLEGAMRSATPIVPPSCAASKARIGVCALCGRQARGFGYVHQLRWETFPHHRFCSLRCLDAGSASAMRNNGMIDKTDMEQRAIRDARRFLAETLTELGLMEPFYHREADDIDRIIEACVDGFQDFMQRQSPSGDLSF